MSFLQIVLMALSNTPEIMREIVSAIEVISGHEDAPRILPQLQSVGEHIANTAGDRLQQQTTNEP